MIWRFLTRPRNLIVLVAAVVATAMVVVAVTPIADPDVWWVAAAGREMLARHAVPTANVFSFVEPSHPWLMHEWLFGPPYALALARFGPAAFSAIALGVMAVELALVAKGTIGQARHAWVGLGMILAAVGFFGGRFLSARPTGVAMVFPIALTLVAFAPRFDLASLALATLIELVWTNAHGSFPLGVVIVLVAAIDQTKDRPFRLAAAGVMALASLVNPYGLALHRFVWGYFRGGDGVYRLINLHIREFGSFPRAWGATVGPAELVALVLFVALALSAARDPRLRARAVFCLGMFALAVLHARHFELAGLLSCLLLVPHADALADRYTSAPLPRPFPPISGGRAATLDAPLPPEIGGKGSGEGGQNGRTPSPRVIAALVLVPAYAIAAGAFAAACRHRTDDEWTSGGPPLARAIASLPDNANAVVPFTTAGFAIWYGFPRGVRVFFDSRNDCYSADAFAAFWLLETTTTPPEVRRTALAVANADAALVPEGHPLATFLATEPGWTLSQEGRWRVFLRTR